MNHTYGRHHSLFSWCIAAAFVGAAAVNGYPRGKPFTVGWVGCPNDSKSSKPNSVRDQRPVAAIAGDYSPLGEIDRDSDSIDDPDQPGDESLANAPQQANQDEVDIDTNTHPIAVRRETLAMVLPTNGTRSGKKMVGGVVNRNNAFVPWWERWNDFWWPAATNIGQKYKDENVLILGGFDHILPSQIDKMCLEDDGKYAPNNRRSRRKPLAIRTAMEVQTRMGSRLVRTGAIGKANEKAVRSCALSVMTEWKVPRAKQSDVIDYVIELSFITSMRTIRAERLARVENRTNRLGENDSRRHRWNPRWWFNNHHNEDDI